MTYRFTISHPKMERTMQRLFTAAWTRAKVLDVMDQELDSAPYGSVAKFYEIEETLAVEKIKLEEKPNGRK